MTAEFIVPPPRRGIWLSAEERQDLSDALTLASLETQNPTLLRTLRSVIADLGIAEARLESQDADPSRWRVALGKGQDDTPIRLSPDELASLQPALQYVTSDNLRKLLT